VSEFPHKQFNAAVKDDTASDKIRRILEDTKPEAVYFTEHNGQRGAYWSSTWMILFKVPAFSEALVPHLQG
jgi:hypothetical protein